MQSVIIYRNPLEAAIWDSLMNGGFVVVLAFMLAAGAGVGVYMLIDKYTDRYSRIPGTRGLVQKSFLRRHAGKISTAAGFASLWLMHLANVKGWL